ncbi:MAG: hypothetical protein G3M70_05470 [Candidatus Nitronauta litoralis]|uniref:Uncharacterized protein n=1 Tax=Candidatus Nitronauta litoralis TaxID=2705533 RepID=A0A7T0FZN1_9BACT|nr:MAG: hypothetical protein G3M70_05470 [Candidatus Nitronauta litoralis]
MEVYVLMYSDPSKGIVDKIISIHKTHNGAFQAMVEWTKESEEREDMDTEIAVCELQD